MPGSEVCRKKKNLLFGGWCLDTEVMTIIASLS